MADTEKKTPKARRKNTWDRKAAILLGTALAMLLAEALIYAWSNNRCVQVGYAINRETRKNEELKSIASNLNIELALLKAPKSISRIARDQLGLAMPDPEQMIVLP